MAKKSLSHCCCSTTLSTLTDVLGAVCAIRLQNSTYCSVHDDETYTQTYACPPKKTYKHKYRQRCVYATTLTGLLRQSPPTHTQHIQTHKQKHVDRCNKMTHHMYRLTYIYDSNMNTHIQKDNHD